MSEEYLLKDGLGRYCRFCPLAVRFVEGAVRVSGHPVAPERAVFASSGTR